MFTNVLLQAILYLRAAMLRGLAGRTDTRLMAAIRVFIALEEHPRGAGNKGGSQL